MTNNKSNKIIEINDNLIDKIISKYDRVIIDCWAPWCIYCKNIEPIFNSLSIEMNDKYQFCKLNVDDNKKISKKYNIKTIPRILIFKNGEFIDRIVGPLPKEQLKNKIYQIFAKIK